MTEKLSMKSFKGKFYGLLLSITLLLVSVSIAFASNGSTIVWYTSPLALSLLSGLVGVVAIRFWDYFASLKKQAEQKTMHSEDLEVNVKVAAWQSAKDMISALQAETKENRIELRRLNSLLLDVQVSQQKCEDEKDILTAQIVALKETMFAEIEKRLGIIKEPQ